MGVMNVVEGHHAITPSEDVAVWDVDPYAESVLTNPAPFYQELRRRGPLVYFPKYSILATGHHRVITEILGKSDVLVSSRGTGIVDYQVKANWRTPSIILEVDPPYHTKTRAAMLKALTPAMVNGLKPKFQERADSLVRELVARSEFDAMPDLAEQYSIDVFPPSIGLRNVDRQKIIDYGIMVFNANGPDNALTRETQKKGADAVPWVSQACLRENLLPDGLGNAIYEQVDTGAITEEEAVLLVRALIAAGMDATIAAVGNTVWALATNPDQYKLLRENPRLARAAFDESLRLNAPVQQFYRTCIEETEIAGISIPVNAKVMMSYASANLDPAQWGEPERYDIQRKFIGQMTFGAGLHACVGQMIARAEGEAIIAALATQVSEIELISEPVWRPNNFVRSLKSLPVRLIAG